MQFSSNMTVLFAGGDPGGSRAVRECYTVFKAKGFKCFQLNHGWMREFSDNCTRIYSENCVKTIKKEENIDSNITEELIISKINTFLGI